MVRDACKSTCIGRITHPSQAITRDAGCGTLLADISIIVVYERSEDIGKRLIQAALLVIVIQIGCVISNRMCELVSHHILWGYVVKGSYASITKEKFLIGGEIKCIIIVDSHMHA